MLNIKKKNYYSPFSPAKLIVKLLALTIVIAGSTTSTAFAESNTFALSCPKNDTASIQGNVVGCSGPNETPTIADTGAGAKNHQGDLVISVDCGHNRFAGSYRTGSQVTKFGCKHGSPSINVLASAGPTQPGPPKGSGCTKDSCDLVSLYLNPTIQLLSAIFGTIAVISVIFGSIQYASSEGDPQKAGRAKQRIANTIIATVAFLFLYSFLQFIVPGGLFHS